MAAFAQLSLQFPALSRRAALEAGHVSFPNKPHDARSSSTSTVSPSSQNLKITSTVIPAISSLTKVHTVKPLTIAVTTTVATSHVRKEWIPGKTNTHIVAKRKTYCTEKATKFNFVSPITVNRYKFELKPFIEFDFLLNRFWLMVCFI